MENKLFFNDIIFLDTINSTNTFLKKGYYLDKTIIYTYNQTAGKGRNNKEWLNFKDKNLALSILFKYINISSIWYIAACSLALIDLLEDLGINGAWIKWPNDIYIKDSKISGILAESVWEGNKQKELIIGVGININSGIEELSVLDNKATSLFIESGSFHDLSSFFSKYSKELVIYFSLIEENKIDQLKEKWIKKSNIIGKEVEWVNENNRIDCKVVDINLDGAIVLNTNNQVIITRSGEIKLKI